SIGNIWLASLLPVVSNAVIISVELYIFYSQPYWLGVLTVGAGELIAVTLVGCPLFRYVIERNKHLTDMIGASSKK
ncbi:MAG: QueT transporter family protein, partial [Ruminococcaceae bacterium]|nr:QueT transporter family protein [Oscillospiraceae bacterium]